MLKDIVKDGEKKKEVEFFVAGLAHHSGYEKIKDLIVEDDDTIILEPEPENPYDPYAIKVIFPTDEEMVMIGYVPMKGKVSEEVSGLMGLSAFSYDCEIVGHYPDVPKWKRLKLKATFFMP